MTRHRGVLRELTNRSVKEWLNTNFPNVDVSPVYEYYEFFNTPI